MSKRWTPEGRRRQAEVIRASKPWERSTGPRSVEGKQRASRNAWKGGHRPMLRTLARMIAGTNSAGIPGAN